MSDNPTEPLAALQAQLATLATTLEEVRTKTREFVDVVDIAVNSAADGADTTALRTHSARFANVTAPMDTLQKQITEALAAVSINLENATLTANLQAQLAAQISDVAAVKAQAVAERDELEALKASFQPPKRDEALDQALDALQQQLSVQRVAFQQQISELENTISTKDKTNAVLLQEVQNLKTLNGKVCSCMREFRALSSTPCCTS